MIAVITPARISAAQIMIAAKLMFFALFTSVAQ